MALVLREFVKYYKWTFEDVADHRVEDWFMMTSPWPVAVLSLIYLQVILQWGPQVMKDRKAFNIDRLLVWYNVAQIAACIYIVFEGTKMLLKYNHLCQPVDYTTSEDGMHTLHIAYVYFMIKAIDLFDTVFFIMRKKENQISFLHVYHHWGMVGLSWVWVKFLAGGTTLYVIVFNSLVHVVMYSYYLLSAYDKKNKESVWWKKHITQLQLFQFIILSFQHIYQLTTGCNYPGWVLIVYLIQSANMLFLFGDFYVKAYIKKRPVAKDE